MTGYKIIKYCMRCKQRFVVAKGESRKRHCDSCQEQIDKENEEMEE